MSENRLLNIYRVREEISSGCWSIYSDNGVLTLRDNLSKETIELCPCYYSVDKIDSFTMDNLFLSNFYRCPIEFNGITYRSSEAAYQAQKCPDRAQEFIDLGPNEAKKLGQTVEIIPEWEEIKEAVMMEILKVKFSDEELRIKLIRTGDAALIEGNTWNDTFWGVCNGVGQNRLGYHLTLLRDWAVQLNQLGEMLTPMDEQLKKSYEVYAEYADKPWLKEV